MMEKCLTDCLAEINAVYGECHPDGDSLWTLAEKADKDELSALTSLLRNKIACAACCGNAFDQDTEEDCTVCNSQGELTIDQARKYAAS